MGRQRIGGGFDPLGHVRIPKVMGFRLFARLPVEEEGVDAAGLFAHLIHVVKRARPVDLKARGPKGIVDRHVGEGYGPRLAYMCRSAHGKNPLGKDTTSAMPAFFPALGRSPR